MKKIESEVVPDAVVDTVPAAGRRWRVKAYTTGGGIVVRDGRALLLQRKNGEMRLPKGHLEHGETLAECAVREVREESGVAAPRIVARLGVVRNHFAHKWRRFVRDEHWYLMTVDDPTIGEPEPQWTPVWRPLEESESMLTFESERIAMRWARDAVSREALAEPSLLDSGAEGRSDR